MSFPRQDLYLLQPLDTTIWDHFYIYFQLEVLVCEFGAQIRMKLPIFRGDSPLPQPALQFRQTGLVTGPLCRAGLPHIHHHTGFQFWVRENDFSYDTLPNLGRLQQSLLYPHSSQNESQVHWCFPKASGVKPAECSSLLIILRFRGLMTSCFLVRQKVYLKRLIVFRCFHWYKLEDRSLSLIYTLLEIKSSVPLLKPLHNCSRFSRFMMLLQDNKQAFRISQLAIGTEISNSFGSIMGKQELPATKFYFITAKTQFYTKFRKVELRVFYFNTTFF